jgi:NADH-quinone oxidoreductase subunit N
MTLPELLALGPLILLSSTSVAILLAISFGRHHRLAAGLALVGLCATLISLPALASAPLPASVGLLLINPYTLFYTGLFSAASAGVTLLSYSYLEARHEHREEFYVLVLVATLGATVLAASRHFVTFFLGLETLSISLYALIGYPRQNRRNFEASVKYLVLATTASAFLLFGLALLYAATGAMDFAQWASAAAEAPGVLNGWVVAGLSLMLTGVGFKLAVVPFHLWAPDIYEGAPAPVAAFVATVSKGSVVAWLLRFMLFAHLQTSVPFFTIVATLAVLSMFAGNLLALLQNNVKRLLAYSSISHLGYLLVALLASGDEAATAATFYLVTYFITNLGAFGVITALSGAEREADRFDDYTGLFWRRPGLAGVLTAMLFSLAGIPLTAGFVGKFYLILVGASSALWGLVMALVVSSLIGLYYYLRLIVTLYLRPAGIGVEQPQPARPIASALVLASLLILLLWLGLFPESIISLITSAMVGLTG